jgi:enamine deaminase RidA (YjgF/YER057c/UK114 family)
VRPYTLPTAAIGTTSLRRSAIRSLATILPNHGDLVATQEVRSKVLGDRKPASTLIVGGLANPAWKIEVEGIAVA